MEERLKSVSQAPNSIGIIINGERYSMSFEYTVIENTISLYSSNRLSGGFHGYLDDVDINGKKYPNDPDGALKALEFVRNLNNSLATILSSVEQEILRTIVQDEISKTNIMIKPINI